MLLPRPISNKTTRGALVIPSSLLSAQDTVLAFLPTHPVSVSALPQLQLVLDTPLHQPLDTPLRLPSHTPLRPPLDTLPRLVTESQLLQALDTLPRLAMESLLLSDMVSQTPCQPESAHPTMSYPYLYHNHTPSL